MTAKKTMSFQAETKQLLDLMVHSIYIHKEIFLRELISNASDALEALRFKALTNPELIEDESKLEIFIELNKDERTLTISDNGIGMTYDEVVENIGTIARSGSKQLFKQLKENSENQDKMELIGQFGVGFYSSFMAADEVTLITKSPFSDTGVKWISSGDGSYTIEECEKEEIGTEITLKIREDEDDESDFDEFLNQYSIQNLVKKYSDYIRFPIKMNFYTEEQPKDDEGNPVKDAEPEIKVETKTLNSMVPLWERSKSEIKDDEYNDFYKSNFHDWKEPFDKLHIKAEGRIQYTALLFIPSAAPFDFYTKEFDKGINLYSKHVFVMSDCKDMLPEYLKFVRGLVDSPDFSLNISREILQHTRNLRLIGNNLEKKVLSLLKDKLKNDRKKYQEFWSEFGKAIKMGLMNPSNKTKLQDLLIFQSSKSEEYITLKEYVERMKEGQEVIYYASGKDKEILEKLPQMELLKEKDFEVLYLTEQIDEFAVSGMIDYEGKKFQSISRGDLNLGGEEEKDKKEESEEEKNENNEILKSLKENLKEKVSDVRFSSRLKSSAVCLVTGEDGLSIGMEQILKAMDKKNASFMKSHKILEINPNHKLFSKIKEMHKEDGNSDKLKSYSEMLYAQAILMEGLELDDPIKFANQLADLMADK